jgi:hypothetical protein
MQKIEGFVDDILKFRESTEFVNKMLDKVHVMVRESKIARRVLGRTAVHQTCTNILRIAWIMDKKQQPVYPKALPSDRYIYCISGVLVPEYRVTETDSNRTVWAEDDLAENYDFTVIFRTGVLGQTSILSMGGLYNTSVDSDRLAKEVFDFMFFGTWPTTDGQCLMVSD